MLLLLLLLRAVYRVVDVVTLSGRLRQAYLVCWRALPNPYAASASSGEELTYGECFASVARGLLARHGCDPSSVVVDLGSGRGNVLLAARSLGARARGVELLAAHVEAAGAALRAVGADVVVGDAAEADVAEATHVWASWLTWGAETRARVRERLRLLPVGARVFAVGYGALGEGFTQVSVERVACSWGYVDVVVSRRA